MCRFTIGIHIAQKVERLDIYDTQKVVGSTPTMNMFPLISFIVFGSIKDDEQRTKRWKRRQSDRSTRRRAHTTLIWASTTKQILGVQKPTVLNASQNKIKVVDLFVNDDTLALRSFLCFNASFESSSFMSSNEEWPTFRRASAPPQSKAGLYITFTPLICLISITMDGKSNCSFIKTQRTNWTLQLDNECGSHFKPNLLGHCAQKPLYDDV